MNHNIFLNTSYVRYFISFLGWLLYIGVGVVYRGVGAEGLCIKELIYTMNWCRGWHIKELVYKGASTGDWCMRSWCTEELGDWEHGSIGGRVYLGPFPSTRRMSGLKERTEMVMINVVYISAQLSKGEDRVYVGPSKSCGCPSLVWVVYMHTDSGSYRLSEKM